MAIPEGSDASHQKESLPDNPGERGEPERGEALFSGDEAFDFPATPQVKPWEETRFGT